MSTNLALPSLDNFTHHCNKYPPVSVPYTGIFTSLVVPVCYWLMTFLVNLCVPSCLPSCLLTIFRTCAHVPHRSIPISGYTVSRLCSTPQVSASCSRLILECSVRWAFPDHVTSPRLRRHLVLCRSHFLHCLRSPLPSLHQDRRFHSIRMPSDHAARRPTPPIRIAPHSQPPSGSRRPQDFHQSDSDSGIASPVQKRPCYI